MPYDIKQENGKYCVVKQTTGETMKCYDVEADAIAYQQALYASEPGRASYDSNDPEMYAVVGDPKLKSTWKLPIPDVEHIGMAITALDTGGLMGQKVDLQSGERAQAKRRLHARIMKVDMSQDDRKRLLDRLDALRSMPGSLVLRSVTPEGEIEGYLAIYGSETERDAYGTWFDQNAMPEMELDRLPIDIRYEHGMDGQVGKAPIGQVLRVWFDKVGVAFSGLLDKAHPHFQRLIDEIKRGLLATSTGTLGYLAEFDDAGRFKYWPVQEVSLTAHPAEDRMPVVGMVRSADGTLTPFSDLWKRPKNLTTSVQAQPIDGTRSRSGQSTSGVGTKKHPTETRTGTMTLTLETLGVAPTATLEEVFTALVDAIGEEAAKAMIESVMGGGAGPSAPPAPDNGGGMPPMDNGGGPAAMSDGRSQDVKALLAKLLANQKPVAKNDEMTALRAQMEALKKQMIQAPVVDNPTPAQGNRNGVHVQVSEPRKYWGRSLSDLLFVYEIEKARGIRPTEDFMRAIGGRTEIAIEKRDPIVYNNEVRSLMKATRSDEIVTSTNSGNGDEWVGVAYSDVLWEKARNNRIFQMLVAKGMRVEEVQPGFETVTIYTEGADPTVYTITQSADLDATSRPTVVVPVTAPGTGQVILTPGYLGMAVAYTSVFEEDSLIAAAPQFNKQMNEKAEETIEQLFFNGDTASSTNVNYDGGTANAAQYFLASNGARKYALVTGSSTSRDGGALDENDFRLTLKLMPSAIRTRRGQLAFCFDPDTHNTALNIAAIKTDDVRRTNATITDGMLSRIYGIDCFESGFIPLADTDGKVTYNSAGTTGSLLAIYAPFWAMGWKRRVTIETSKDILAQSNLIVATFRVGFVPRGAGAATETYDITIA